MDHGTAPFPRHVDRPVRQIERPPPNAGLIPTDANRLTIHMIHQRNHSRGRLFLSDWLPITSVHRRFEIDPPTLNAALSLSWSDPQAPHCPEVRGWFHPIHGFARIAQDDSTDGMVRFPL
jgi:hypothetical protein